MMVQPASPNPESRSIPSASLLLILVAPALFRQGSHEAWASCLAAADEEDGVELDIRRA